MADINNIEAIATDKRGGCWRIDGTEDGKYVAIMLNQWGCQCSWVPFLMSPSQIVSFRAAV